MRYISSLRVCLILFSIMALIAHFAVIIGASYPNLSISKPTILEDNCSSLRGNVQCVKSMEIYDRKLNLTASNETKRKILINIISNYLNNGCYVEAIKSCDRALNMTKSDQTITEIKILLKIAYNKCEDCENAIYCYNCALNITKLDNKTKADIFYKKAYKLHELKRYDEAIWCYDNSLILYDEDKNETGEILSNKGKALMDIGKYREAITCFNESLNLTKWNDAKAEIWKDKGFAHYKLREYDEAIYSYNKSIEFNLSDNKTKIASLNNRGLAMDYSGRYDEAIRSYDEALNLVDPTRSYNFKNNTIIILNNKGNALKQLNRSAEAAMVYAKANELEMGPQIKHGIFIAFLLLYSILASAGYLLYRRRKLQLTAVMLSVNLLGFLAVVWIFSGLFDPALIWQILLGGLMMAVVAGTLWSFLGFPSDPWKTQIILTFRDFERKGALICGMMKATGFVAAIGYLFLASAFYFRFRMDSDKFMAAFLGGTLFVITLTGLFVALPPIMGALLSKNLDRDSRDMLQIILFSYLGIVFFYLLLILWSFDIGGFCLHDMGEVGIPLNISPIFLGTAISLLLFAFVIPYLSGWMRAKRHSETLLEREISWIDRLLNVLEFPTPSLYVSKLEDVLSDIGKDKTVSDPEDDETALTTLRERDLHLVDPRLRYEVFLRDLQDRIVENIRQFDELKEDEEKLMGRARIYAQAYRIRKDEIARSIEKERNIKPKLLIILIFVLAPILTQILSIISEAVTESLSRLLSGGILH